MGASCNDISNEKRVYVSLLRFSNSGDGPSIRANNDRPSRKRVYSFIKRFARRGAEKRTFPTEKLLRNSSSARAVNFAHFSGFVAPRRGIPRVSSRTRKRKVIDNDIGDSRNDSTENFIEMFDC